MQFKWPQQKAASRENVSRHSVLNEPAALSLSLSLALPFSRSRSLSLCKILSNAA